MNWNQAEKKLVELVGDCYYSMFKDLTVYSPNPIDGNRIRSLQYTIYVDGLNRSFKGNSWEVALNNLRKFIMDNRSKGEKMKITIDIPDNLNISDISDAKWAIEKTKTHEIADNIGYKLGIQRVIKVLDKISEGIQEKEKV